MSNTDSMPIISKLMCMYLYILFIIPRTVMVWSCFHLLTIALEHNLQSNYGSLQSYYDDAISRFDYILYFTPLCPSQRSLLFIRGYTQYAYIMFHPSGFRNCCLAPHESLNSLTLIIMLWTLFCSRKIFSIQIFLHQVLFPL